MKSLIWLCRYAAEQLTWLATKLLGIAPDSQLQPLQRQISDCDKHQGANASVPADEDLSSFDDIVGASSSPSDVEAMINELTRQS